MSVGPTSAVPPAVIRDVTAFARSLVAAVRTRQMYMAEHPATHAAIDRLQAAAGQMAAHADLDIGVSATTLLANGEFLPPDRRVTEAAALLHDTDILRLRFVYAPSRAQLADFIALLGFDADMIRQRGGPALLWQEYGHTAIEIGQIDYEAILAHRNGPAKPDAEKGRDAGPPPGGPARQPHDRVWDALVKSMSGGAGPYNRSTTERLVQIARSADDVQALAEEAAASQEASNPSQLQAAQAATVLSTFDRLVTEIEATAPQDVSTAIRNIASAATRMNPTLVMHAVAESAESGVGSAVTRAMGDWFNDEDIARLLAQTMAKEGRASGRMAAALHTLAPDADRRHRVLTLASTLTDTSPAGPSSEVASAWKVLEDILTGPADSLYTSSDYASQLQEAEFRSHRLRLQAPAHLDSWVGSVSEDSMRTLSVTLLVDLFTIEESPLGINELAMDLARLAEDLLGATDIEEADRVLRALNPETLAADPRRAAAAREALDHLAASDAVRQMAAAAGDLDEAQAEWFESICRELGPIVLQTLLPTLVAAPEGASRDRLLQIVTGFGEAAIPPLAELVASPDWPGFRTALTALSRIGGPSAAAVLHPLASSSDPRRAREAITVLLAMDDPAALRTVDTILRAGAPGARQMALDAVVASRHPRGTALLAAVLRDTRPIGESHGYALQLLAALRRIGDEQAVPAIAESMRAFSWNRLSETIALKRTAVGVLWSMKHAEARDALALAAKDGDLLLRRHAKRALRARG